MPSSPAQDEKKRRRNAPDTHMEYGEDTYEVKALLDDAYDYDEDGNLVWYFQVLWMGNWPESQNPTWEPQANISDDLVAAYLKKKEKKTKTMNGYLTDLRKRPPPARLPAKRYSSVAEAFEGDISETATSEAHGRGVQEDGETVERFLVTTDDWD